jgi:putative transposase
MKHLGLQGVRRGEAVCKAIGDMTAARPPDRGNQQFKADRPNQSALQNSLFSD